LVDRHWARRHPYLGDPPTAPPTLADEHQPVRGGHDALCRGLRRPVSDPPPGPAVAVLLADSVSGDDRGLAAIPQPARVGLFCRQYLCNRFAVVLVHRAYS